MLMIFVFGATAYAEDIIIPLDVPLDKRGYEHIATKQGVKVYKHIESKIIRLGADGTFDAPPAQVLTALLDYRGQIGKIARLSEARVLRREHGWLTVYQRLNLPVISDRDFTLKVSWSKHGEQLRVSYSALSRGGLPERSGVVRVTTHHGAWQLQPLDGGQATRVRFQVAIDLAGWLPRWMAKSGSGKEVPQLFAALNKLAQRAGFFSQFEGATCSSKCL